MSIVHLSRSSARKCCHARPRPLLHPLFHCFIGHNYICPSVQIRKFVKFFYHYYDLETFNDVFIRISICIFTSLFVYLFIVL